MTSLSEIPRKVEKPWGHEIWWARTERYVGKLLHVLEDRYGRAGTSKP